MTNKLRRYQFQRGELIFHRDDPADRMHIISQGTVRVSITSEDGREKDIALLQTGECFGEMALLDGSSRSATATATAIEHSQTFGLFRQDFMDFLEEHPQVVAETTSLLTRRLRNVNQMLGDMAFLDVPTRLAKQLLDLAGTYAGDESQSGAVEVPIGQEELARLVGASRETISRALNSYWRLGILTTSHRRVTITNLQAIERMASF